MTNPYPDHPFKPQASPPPSGSMPWTPPGATPPGPNPWSGSAPPAASDQPASPDLSYAYAPGGPVSPVGPASDPSLRTLAILVLVGGIWSLTVSLTHFVAAIGFCVTVVSGTYLLVAGILCTIKGANLLNGSQPYAAPPRGYGILLIFNILACDVVGMALGIVILVMADQVRQHPT